MGSKEIFLSIGNKFRDLRSRRKLTLAEVAEAIDRSTSLVGSVERGDRCPSLPTLIELAEFYHTPLADLFEDDLSYFQKQIGSEVGKLLTRESKTVADLANMTELNFFELSEFIQGKKLFMLEELRKIAKALNVPVKTIMPDYLRYVHHIEHYLRGLGFDQQSIQNVVDYIESKIK